VEEGRPTNAPKDATYVKGALGGWWQHCTLGTVRAENHCMIYNWKGEPLYDEAFIPYDGGAAASAEELEIPSRNPNSGPDRIALKNGRILIPRSDRSKVKAFLDKLNASRQ
jgi:hypothetical protein